MVEYNFGEENVKDLIKWAESAKLPETIILSDSEHIIDTRKYIRANINDIKQHFPDEFYNPAIIRLYRIKSYVENHR